MLRRRAAPPPDSAALAVGRLLVASEGRPIGRPVIDRALELAKPARAPVHVLSIARVWGTSLGFPNPGLMPTKREWAEQREIVDRAVRAFERAGLEATGQVVATRRARKRILQEADKRGADAIVMGCDDDRGFLGDFVWAHEPYRVARRARVPVFLVPAPDTRRRRRPDR